MSLQESAWDNSFFSGKKRYFSAGSLVFLQSALGGLQIINGSLLLEESLPRPLATVSWSCDSGTEKEHKPKLLSPDIFWRGLPREGVGAKKFGMSLETRENKFFGRDIPGSCWDIPAVPEKFEKKKFGFNFWPLVTGMHWTGFPDRNTYHKGKIVPKMSKFVFAEALGNVQTNFGHLFDMFSTCCHDSSFWALPVTSLESPTTVPNNCSKFEVAKQKRSLQGKSNRARQKESATISQERTTSTYTPARKYYIHKMLFSEFISRKNTFQLQEIFFRNYFPENYISRIRL